ncbi:MAG: hypothetical protein WCC10_15355 [Tumebacillaceae bacterium]
MSDQPTAVTDASEEVAAASAVAAIAPQIVPKGTASDPQETDTEPLNVDIWDAQRHLRAFTMDYLILVLLSSLFLILYLWSISPASTFSLLPFLDPSDIPQVRPYMYAFLSAGCGGTVYCFQAFNRYYSRQVLDLAKNWTWYLTHPLLSGTYGAIFFAMLNGHLLGIQVASGKASTIIGFSFLVGFGTKQVDAKIKDTLKTLFGTTG